MPNNFFQVQNKLVKEEGLYAKVYNVVPHVTSEASIGDIGRDGSMGKRPKKCSPKITSGNKKLTRNEK